MNTQACACCGETDFSPNTELFELYDRIVCPDCASGVFENQDDECEFSDDMGAA